MISPKPNRSDYRGKEHYTTKITLTSVELGLINMQAYIGLLGL